jgi:molybdopterin adenylyltransferase
MNNTIIDAPPTGGRLDLARVFRPVRIALLTISDTRDEETDTSGTILADRIQTSGHSLAERAIVADNIEAIRSRVLAWCNGGLIDAIITTGGTGLCHTRGYSPAL